MYIYIYIYRLSCCVTQESMSFTNAQAGGTAVYGQVSSPVNRIRLAGIRREQATKWESERFPTFCWQGFATIRCEGRACIH